jgi:hypothetical protein
MEGKPIRRNDNIKQLSRDHHYTLLFSWKIRKGLREAVETERIKRYVRHFWEHDMEPHFREEEEILFAPVQDEPVRKALEEHRQIKAQVDAVLLAPAKIAGKHLMHLAGMVDAHVRYEERELFPYLESVLTPAQLESIGRQLHEAPPLQEDFEDNFWVKK